MELINRSDCFDSHIVDKDLVNMYGGVAYDHESMPKVVAVHTLTPVRQTGNHGRGQHLPRMDRMPRKWYSMMIGIRSKPQDSDVVGSQRPYVDLKEHFDLLVKNKKVSLSVAHFVFRYLITFHFIGLISVWLMGNWRCVTLYMYT